MSQASERELQPGQVIADRYRLEAPIGRGAMGAVWRAVHVRLESPVAIKFLNAAIAGDPDMLERFMREARSAAAVRSSHVVQIFDYGVDGSVPYIAMELLLGEPLDERLAARGMLAPPELDKVFGEVARAVSVAHELGVVHRDIKPANIFIAREGGLEVTKVLDFGIAKLIDRPLEAPVGSGTHTGIILGTPNYMSPEQARGHRGVDHRSDLWSLAVLAFECVTGRQPFESDALGDLVVKICTAQPLVPSELAAVPAAFDAWFRRGVDKDPEARFGSAAEMADALHVLLAVEGLAAESRPRSAPAHLELVAAGSTTAGITPSSSARWPMSAPNELTPRSLTAQAVASEVLAPSSPPARRRRLALASVPLLMLGLALVASLSSTPPEPESRVTRASTPSAAISAPSPVPSAQQPSQPAPGLAPISRDGSSAAASEPPRSAEAPASAVAHRAAPRGTARARRPAASSHRAQKSAPTATTTAPRASTSIDPYADRL
jgi:serine/threonine protein kinase